MPYKLRKAPKKDLYWVITIETGKKHSKLPIPMDKAKAQMRVLESALKGEAKPITMSKSAFIKEHKNLLKVLASKDPKKLKAEALDQAEELKKVVKGQGSSCRPHSPNRSSGRASVFALTCIDPRYAFDVAYMLNNIKELHADYDLFTSAGASVGAQKKEWTKAFFDNLALGIQLHGISEVWCFDHLDCGMYKATFGLEDDMDPKIHIVEMNKLQKLVKKKHPSLKFRKFIIQPNGDIKEVTGKK